MKVLVLGGTRFLGRHLVQALLARNHEVTLFNRGRTAPDLFAQVEQIRGDRDGGAQAFDGLAGRHWDAVIDTCGYVPRAVRASCDALRDAVGTYVFISSISVYADFSQPDLTEESALAELADPASEDVTAHYGALKAACEREVQAVFGPRALRVRPGLIVGPFDPTGRFTYWPQRIAAGGEVLAPGEPQAPVQLIDARDLAEWIVRALGRGPGGVFNATGPAHPLSFGALLAACQLALASTPPATLTWCAETFLLAHDVAPWTGLPLWLPAAEQAVHQVSIRRALDAGLSFRPLSATLVDTLAWTRSPQFAPPSGAYANVGLTREREAELLRLWRARASV
ncbi:MAG: NAD-dependent epimerase/dehydratase family protein [Burkholderiaceae bacterium]|nr:NAD-dependent epimerase/dehydratase family protein [Burkholderiaceae bacterium]